MSRAHPAPGSDTMRELILMQAIINAYNAPPKFDIAAKALGITVHAVSGRYNRLKKKVEAAGLSHPLYDIGENGQPIKRGRGRPPKRLKTLASDKAVSAVLAQDHDDDEDGPEAPGATVVYSTTGNSKNAKSGDRIVKLEYPSSNGEGSLDT
ncbi:hypothetical protein TWF569_004919 [Orbilia oligospora]|uniref:Uncharacterized protein n=1 Tax=Orbilia oligospora TaxID=2813651 RepID=A0A7C8NLQ3_ORBOL|nr:hypothetical protein TWF102_008438 [Orbilia oligospora]KAF3109561.1 hypothetical protein TWF706_001425 [Orbilia oligospora]KAF3114708.1 hypothetical protein TWF103_000445 [Orbilia oligospora]KAF3119197.1 hypothetical protein TWF703_003587 [Orbilia oligospora]KAF3122956.1 hypothetical protein TWF594_002571 [Orbilia oligospora]